jgi:hypothetical protein
MTVSHQPTARAAQDIFAVEAAYLLAKLPAITTAMFEMRLDYV